MSLTKKHMRVAAELLSYWEQPEDEVCIDVLLQEGAIENTDALPARKLRNDEAVNLFCKFFKLFNPRFDEERFRAAIDVVSAARANLEGGE